MILAALGKLCIAQSLTDADEISENVIKIAAIDYSQFTDLWWVVDTYVVAAAGTTFKFSLVLDSAVGLNGTGIEVCAVEIAAITDLRVATIGRHIVSLNIGKMLKEMLDTDVSDYEYIGQKNIINTSGTITINASLSPTEPQSETHRQKTVSNVGIPTITSDKSGF